MKILIVDDEPLARKRLQRLLAKLYPSAVIAEAANGAAALANITATPPDIVLLDIRMPKMDGLDLAQQLLTLTAPPAVIFTTAYQDHALKAFDVHAVDYLLKPIKPARLKAAIEHVVKTMQRSETTATTRAQRHLTALVHGNIRAIPIDNIYYLQADQKYITVFWSGGETLINATLVALEAKFKDDFIRIHRHTLVAIKYIAGLNKKANNQHTLTLTTLPIELVVSRRHLLPVKTLMKAY